jgi:hypothetical protein
MREYRYELSPEDQKSLFMWAWYHAPQLRWQRLFAGPACLVLSFLFLAFRVSDSYYFIGMGLAVAGIYYIVRPFRQLRKSKREGIHAKLVVTSKTLKYVDEANETTIEASMIVSMIQRKRYMFLGVKADKLLWIPFDLDRIEKRPEFLERLARMTDGDLES